MLEPRAFDVTTIQDSFINHDGSGILLVDKPVGWSSHDVVAQARRFSGIRRIGHSGTLDPLATGLLIILIGRQYTKLQDFFLHLDKSYDCTATLGLTTDSYDSDGMETWRVEWQEVAQITKEKIERVIVKFRGEITQTVPSFSAVKVKGQKLYHLARNQQTIKELPTRQVTIRKLVLSDFSKDETTQHATFSFTSHVSSGTYIRSLAHDIGQVLEVGATVTALRRTKIGHLNISQAKPLAEYFPKTS